MLSSQPVEAGDEIAGELIARAQQMFCLLYPAAEHPALDFNSDKWNLRPLSAPRRAKPATILFREFNSGIPLPNEFSGLLKAMIVLRRFKPLNAKRYVDAYRYFWAAISNRLHGARFCWPSITADDYEKAEQLMKDHELEQSTIYSFVMCLNAFRKWLDSSEICEGIEWTPLTKDPKTDRIRTTTGRKKSLDRLPTRRAIEGLGEIYRMHAKEPQDRLLICAVGLLLVAGFRISELLSLPLDCWVEELQRGRMRYGIRYWNRKAKGGVWQWAVRWLSPMGAELTRELLAEITKLTESARTQARILEADPSRVSVPGFEGRHELTSTEVAPIFGTSRLGLAQRTYYKRLRLTTRRSEKSRGRESLWLKSDVEAELLARRGTLHTFDLGNGKYQMLSDSLLIAHQGFFSKHGTLPFLVMNLSDREIEPFLAGKKSKGYFKPSAFDRFGIKEAGGFTAREGESPRMRSNMLRHWLNTVANKAGMSAAQISMWMQRTNPAHTLLYLHSASDIADLTRDEIREGKLVGPRAEEFKVLPLEKQADYLAGINAVHKTATGRCAADFSRDQCEFNKTCELGCVFFLHNPEDEVERSNLLIKRSSCITALVQIEAAERQGRKMVSRQREMNELMISKIDHLLAHGETSRGEKE
jgi:hypothetical protein